MKRYGDSLVEKGLNLALMPAIAFFGLVAGVSLKLKKFSGLKKNSWLL